MKIVDCDICWAGKNWSEECFIFYNAWFLVYFIQYSCFSPQNPYWNLSFYICLLRLLLSCFLLTSFPTFTSTLSDTFSTILLSWIALHNCLLSFHTLLPNARMFSASAWVIATIISLAKANCMAKFKVSEW